MIQSNSLTTSEMAHAADCSKQSIVRIRSNLKVFGNVRAPRNGVGRPRSITPSMLEALCEYLMEKPTLYQDEMALFLWDEFGKHVTIQSISRALASVGWSKNAARQIAKERNADLRDFYVHNISSFKSYQLVFVDESGCDKGGVSTDRLIPSRCDTSPNLEVPPGQTLSDTPCICSGWSCTPTGISRCYRCQCF